MKKGFYAGSFDPFTNGHLHVAIQALEVFDKLIIGIGDNVQKTRRKDVFKMKDAIEKLFKRIGYGERTKVIIYRNEPSVKVDKENKCDFLVRGIRNDMDYQYEENLASINQEISGLDTIYFRAGELGNISSSMIMELMECGYDVSKYLPKEIYKIMKR